MHYGRCTFRLEAAGVGVTDRGTLSDITLRHGSGTRSIFFSYKPSLGNAQSSAFGSDTCQDGQCIPIWVSQITVDHEPFTHCGLRSTTSMKLSCTRYKSHQNAY